MEIRVLYDDGKKEHYMGRMIFSMKYTETGAHDVGFDWNPEYCDDEPPPFFMPKNSPKWSQMGSYKDEYSINDVCGTSPFADKNQCFYYRYNLTWDPVDPIPYHHEDLPITLPHL